MIHTPSPRIRPAGPRRATPPLPGGRGPAVASKAASDSGFGLIEVLISSLLVAVIAIGTFTGFDVTNRVTANQRARAQADSIAQQWEERLRGVQTSDIAALQKSFCVNDQGVEVYPSLPCPGSVAGYTGTIFAVTTTGKFVSDASGAGSCSKESGSADYIQTTTQVTWPSIGTGKPVSETSVVTPPVSGQLLVQDYNGPNPIPGVSVTATGPEPATTSKLLATGPNGCALFTTLEPGKYAISVNQLGYVEKDGNQAYSTTRNLVAGSSSNVSLAYDRAGDIKTTFVNATTGVAVPGETFMANNLLMTLPRGFGKPNTAALEVASPPSSLFPFYYQAETPSYTLYAGGCASNDPASWEVPTADKAVTMDPGGHVGPVKLEMPPVAALLTTNGVTKITTGIGYINELVTGLPAKVVTPVVSPQSGPYCGPLAKRNIAATAAGALPYKALPFGRYELCVWAKVPTTRKYVQIFENKTKAGVNLGTINFNTSPGTSPGECP